MHQFCTCCWKQPDSFFKHKESDASACIFDCFHLSFVFVPSDHWMCTELLPFLRSHHPDLNRSGSPNQLGTLSGQTISQNRVHRIRPNFQSSFRTVVQDTLANFLQKPNSSKNTSHDCPRAGGVTPWREECLNGADTTESNLSGVPLLLLLLLCRTWASVWLCWLLDGGLAGWLACWLDFQQSHT